MSNHAAFDYVVVGAGTAGCVLANRLSADGRHSVLLLEAGGGDAHPWIRMPLGFLRALQQPRFTWGYQSEPEPQLNGRVLPAPLRDAARAAGHRLNDDYDGEHHDGLAAGDVAIDRRGRRASSARAYLHPVRGRRNLSVWTQARSERVLFDGRRATGVQLRRAGRPLTVHARREVILAGGTYGSPQLLMCSGIGPGDQLQRHGIAPVHLLPGVGENLIEHPRMPLQYTLARPVSFLNQLRLDRAVLSVLRWASLGSGAFATQVCHGTVLLKTDPALDRPDFQLLCNPVRLDAKLWFPGIAPAQPHAFYITVCQLYAKSRGRITLRSPDPAAAPRIALNLFSHEDDFRSMRAALRAARALYATPPLAELIDVETLPGGALQSDAELDDAIRALGGITHHPVGTCAMGTGPQAVVDPRLRVHGVAGLRVADASVMPGIPSSTPTRISH